MQILGIGPLELLLIIIVAIIVLGPKGMVNGAREVGKLIRKIVRSPVWRDVVDTSREIREFPNKIAREAGIDQDIRELKQTTHGVFHEIGQDIEPVIQPVENKKETDNQKGEPDPSHMQ
jgi:sec-independent protein translocase protein TatB